MKSFIAFSCTIAACLAFPTDIAEVYLTEDTAGDYNLAFNSKAITRDEKRSEDGTVLGSYTYVDPEGIRHEVTYVSASDLGFVADSDDIPKSVPEGQELIQARAYHLAAVAAEHAKYPHGYSEEKPLPLSEVLDKLVLPEIASLPLEAVPAEDADAAYAKAELLAEYARALSVVAEEYKRVHHA